MSIKRKFVAQVEQRSTILSVACANEIETRWAEVMAANFSREGKMKLSTGTPDQAASMHFC